MKTISKISFNDIENIPQLIKDFLNHKIEGFEENTFSLEHFRKQIHLKQESFTSEQRVVLSTALEQQLSGLTLSKKQRENLNNIKLPDTFTITTGHQLNLFSGPVFFCV
ncbi:bacillithiol biosynthesis protein BshC [Chryseobacterium proteolyticum]|uniref:bacillithiol biosynthesis protein BshC n=1 Tax=Chryseobacterium proteolyticum TaxID=118127 RepID=UPI00398399CF